MQINRPENELVGHEYFMIDNYLKGLRALGTAARLVTVLIACNFKRECAFARVRHVYSEFAENLESTTYKYSGAFQNLERCSSMHKVQTMTATIRLYSRILLPMIVHVYISSNSLNKLLDIL